MKECIEHYEQSNTWHPPHYRHCQRSATELGSYAGEPGFVINEPIEQLGSQLMLPPWVEPQRELIEARVLPLRLPGGKQYGR